MVLDIQYRILNLYKTKQYHECLKACSEATGHEDERIIDFIRLRTQTILAKIAGNGYEEVGYGFQDDEMGNTGIAKTPRPGTSFQKMTAKSSTAMPMNRATTAVKRRTTASSSRTGTARSALRTASLTARAATATAVNAAPLVAGAPLTLTLLTKKDTMFTSAAKSLFEYVLYCEGDVRKALDLATQAQNTDSINTDWWWDFSSAKCYLTLGMHRTAEESLRLALKKNKHIAIYLRLVAMFVELNQPISALEICKQGLSVFHEDTALMTEQARIYDEMGNSSLAVQGYRRVAVQDPMNMEATANIAMYNFYNDQPEIALRYYRRLLATCPVGAEIYNNLGLCCLYCNQWDLILPCFRQAMYYSTTPTTKADIWFNLAHVSLSTGDISLARRCLQLSLAMNSDHTAARTALRAIDLRTTRNGPKG